MAKAKGHGINRAFLGSLETINLGLQLLDPFMWRIPILSQQRDRLEKAPFLLQRVAYAIPHSIAIAESVWHSFFCVLLEQLMTEVGVPCRKHCGPSLKRWECENIELRLFDGGPYPPFMEAVDTYLPGQGFFPGGDGLWRELGDIAKTSGTSIAQRGIMILGNDFGNAVDYNRTRMSQL